MGDSHDMEESSHRSFSDRPQGHEHLDEGHDGLVRECLWEMPPLWPKKLSEVVHNSAFCRLDSLVIDHRRWLLTLQKGPPSMSIERYIETLTLADTNLAPTRLPGFEDALRGTRSGGPPRTAPLSQRPPRLEDLQAVVNAGSLLSFVQGINAQEKDDVLFSVQLAQRGASGEYDRFTETQSWYKKYVEILERLGWTGEQLAFARYGQSQGEIRIDKAALAVIAAIATQNQLAVLQEAVNALETLAEDDGTIRLFDFHTSAKMSANFQIGAVQKAENGALALALGAFYVHGTDARRRFLFFSWGAQKVSFWTAAQKMTLNVTFYAQHREAVQRKLGPTATDFIGGLALG
jgi:hypothetical protein